MAATPGAQAREAQALFNQGRYQEAAETYEAALAEADERIQPLYRLNAAIARFQANQPQQATSHFRELLDNESLQSPSTEYNLARSLYANASVETNATQRIELLQQAANHYLNVIRRNDSDIPARAGAQQLLMELPETLRNAELQDVLDKNKELETYQIVDKLLKGQRSLQADIQSALEDPSPSRIQALEDISVKQRRNSDLIIPLKQSVQKDFEAGRVDGEQNLEELAAHIDAELSRAQADLSTSAQHLRDLLPTGLTAAKQAETNLYPLWKSLAPYEPLLKEDLHRTTNLLATIRAASADTLPDLIDDQKETALLSALFVKRFTEAVPEEGLPAPEPDPDVESTPGATNAPPQMLLTPQERQTILALSESLITHQRAGIDALDQKQQQRASIQQERAQTLIEQIQELLPKDPNQPPNRPPPPQDNPPPPPEDPQNDQPPPEDQPPQDPQDQDDPEADPPPPDDQPAAEEQQEPTNVDPVEEMNESDAKRILQLARQREKEHAEKERQRRMKLEQVPQGQDW